MAGTTEEQFPINRSLCLNIKKTSHYQLGRLNSTFILCLAKCEMQGGKGPWRCKVGRNRKEKRLVKNLFLFFYIRHIFLFLSWKNLDFLLDGCTLKWYGLVGRKGCDCRKSIGIVPLRSHLLSLPSLLYLPPLPMSHPSLQRLMALQPFAIYFPCSK